MNSFFQQLPFLSPASSVLVCETNGMYLKGAVFSSHHHQTRVHFVTQSVALDLHVAVAEVVNQLRLQGWKGHQAVLLTPSVLSSIVELPVSPKHKRNPMQMQELVRWELEPLMLQHNSLSTVGQMFIQMQILSDEQVQEIVARQQGKTKKGVGDGHGSIYSFKRFGELAIEMGFVVQAQVDEVLQRQAWLRTETEAFQCGWTPQATAIELQAEAGSFAWLVSGVNCGVVKQWTDAFATHKVKLTHLYPLLGNAASLVNTTEPALLLEATNGMVVGKRLQDKVVSAIETQHQAAASTLDQCLETYHHLIQPDIQEVWLASSDPLIADLSATLSEIIGREVNTIPAQSHEVSAGMLGFAYSLFHHKAPKLVAAVSVKGAQPPLFQRVEARAILAAVSIAFLVLALELSLWVRSELAQSEHTKVAEQKKEFDAVVAKAKAKLDAVNQAKEQIQAKKEEVKSVTARLDFFGGELPKRTAFLQAFLNSLSSTVTDEVVVNMVEETPSFGIRLAGWAINEKAAQEFIQGFKLAMAPWGVELVDPIVRSQIGRLGLVGYEVQFRLVTQVEIAAQTPATDQVKATKTSKRSVTNANQP
jgi:hypothetical protein